MTDELRDELRSYTLEWFDVDVSNRRPPHARVAVQTPDGEEVLGDFTGDGPVDAIFRAINTATKREARLREFRIDAVTRRQDALGEASVVLELSGPVGLRPGRLDRHHRGRRAGLRARALQRERKVSRASSSPSRPRPSSRRRRRSCRSCAPTAISAIAGRLRASGLSGSSRTSRRAPRRSRAYVGEVARPPAASCGPATCRGRTPRAREHERQQPAAIAREGAHRSEAVGRQPRRGGRVQAQDLPSRGDGRRVEVRRAPGAAVDVRRPPISRPEHPRRRRRSASTASRAAPPARRVRRTRRGGRSRGRRRRRAGARRSPRPSARAPAQLRDAARARAARAAGSPPGTRRTAGCRPAATSGAPARRAPRRRRRAPASARTAGPPGAPPVRAASHGRAPAATAASGLGAAPPAASTAATIEPADVPTNASHSRRSQPRASARPASSERSQASPRTPPPPSTRTSGRRVRVPRR